MKNLLTLLLVLSYQLIIAQVTFQTDVKNCKKIKYKYYTVEWDTLNCISNYTYYISTKHQVENLLFPRYDRFLDEDRINCNRVVDYVSSGYDRGHMCPAQDFRFNKDAQQECFKMSNMTAQVPGFNRGKWKELETQVRAWAYKEDSLLIITGNVVTQVKTIGKLNVPQQQYKIVYFIKLHKYLCFVFPNAPCTKPLMEYRILLKDLKVVTNINFPDFKYDEYENK